MKKKFSIILSLLLALSMIGCGDEPLRDRREDYDYEMGYRDYDGKKMNGWEEEEWEEEPEEEPSEEYEEETPAEEEPADEPEETFAEEEQADVPVEEEIPEETQEAEAEIEDGTETPSSAGGSAPTPTPTPTSGQESQSSSDEIPTSGENSSEQQNTQSSSQENTDTGSSQSDSSSDYSTEGMYRIGQKWEVPGQWSLVVNSVLPTNERDENSGDDPAAVYIVDYTYRNLGYGNPDDGSGLIFWLDDYVTDSEGYMGYSYDLGLPYEPQEIGVGESYNAQICIAVDSNGTFDITVMEYDSNDEYQEATFHIEP